MGWAPLRPKCEATLYGTQLGKTAIAIKRSVAAARHAIASRRIRRSSMTTFKRSGQWSQTLAKVARNHMYGRKAGIHFEDKTVEVRDDPLEHEAYVGGLRRTARAVAKLPSVMVAGGKLGTAFDQYLQEQPQVVTFITQLLHDGTEVAHDRGEQDVCTSSCRQCELERVTRSATEVFMDVTGAEDASAVDDGRGILTSPVDTGVFAPAPEAEEPSDPLFVRNTHGGA